MIIIQTKTTLKIILDIIWKNKLFLMLLLLVLSLIIIIASLITFPLFEIKRDSSIASFFETIDNSKNVDLIINPINLSFILIPICLINLIFASLLFWSLKNKYGYILLLNRKGKYWKNNLLIFSFFTSVNFIILLIMIFSLALAQKLDSNDFKAINLWDLFFGFLQFNIATFIIGYLIGKNIPNIIFAMTLSFSTFLSIIILNIFIFNLEWFFRSSFVKNYIWTLFFHFPTFLFNFGFYNEHARFEGIPYLNPIFKILVMYLLNTTLLLLPLFFVIKSNIFIK